MTTHTRQALAEKIKRLADEYATAYRESTDSGWTPEWAAQLHAAIDALRDHVPEMNQCDGCKQGAPLRGRLHVDKDGKAFMTCEAGQYAEQKEAEPDAGALADAGLTADDAAAHMYPSDLEKFKRSECTGVAFSIPVGCPDELSVPLFTLEQVRAAIAAQGAKS